MSEEHNCSPERCGSRTPTSINKSAQHVNYMQMRTVPTIDMMDHQIPALQQSAVFSFWV
jgi:hypothetical protein